MAKTKKKTTTKKTTKATSKKKSARKRSAPVTDIDKMFSISGAEEKKKATTRKDAVKLPTADLREACDIMVSARVVTKAVQAKGEIAENRVKKHVIDEWCKKFVKTGTRPPTVTYLGDDTQFSFVQTKRIDMDSSKLQALQLLGFDPLEKDEDGNEKYVTLKGMKIDLEAIRRAGGLKLQDKIKAALAKILAEHDVKEILTPIVSFRDNTLDNMVSLARESLDPGAKDDEVLDRLRAMMAILNPRTQIRSASSSISDSECFSFVISSDFLSEE